MPPLPGTETILIVDDELAVLSLTAMMLRRYGYKVISAHSAKEALHLFEVWSEIELDLVMIDIIMPNMNGLELAERIRAFRPELPILYFSAYSERETLRPVLARGIPYIAKPFTSIQLTKRIREMLANPNSRTQAADAQ